jgi:hypothetical protein
MIPLGAAQVGRPGQGGQLVEQGDDPFGGIPLQVLHREPELPRVEELASL